MQRPPSEVYRPRIPPKHSRIVDDADWMKNGLVLDLKMMEGAGNDVYDYSRYGNDGAHTGCKWVEHGLEFNGSSDYVDCGNDESLNINDAITISSWIYISTMQSSVIIGKANMYRLGVHSNGKMRPILTLDGTPHTADYTNTILAAGEWYNLVMTYDKDAGANNEIIYIDGALDKSWTKTGSIGTTISNLFVAAYGGGSSFFNGTISDVRILNRALSAAEIYALYAQSYHTYRQPTPRFFGHPTFSGCDHNTDKLLLDVDELKTSVAACNTIVPDVAGTAAGLHSTTDGKVDDVEGKVWNKIKKLIPFVA